MIQSKQEALLTKPQATIIDESEAIATSLGETKRLRQLTDDLLTIAKADSNTIEIELTDLRFDQTLAPQLASYHDIAISQDKSFTTTIPPKSHASLTLHGLNSYWLSYWTMHLNIPRQAIPSG